MSYLLHFWKEDGSLAKHPRLSVNKPVHGVPTPASISSQLRHCKTSYEVLTGSVLSCSRGWGWGAGDQVI